MKKMMCIIAVITSFMLLIPLAVLGKGETTEKIISAGAVIDDIKKSDTFKVLDKSTDKVTEMSAKEYIFGVVAAEMPALYNEEALKAQAVAAYTYACYKREKDGKKEYDITTDFNTDQSFKSEEQAREDWGEKAEEYVNKIKIAINSVEGQIIYYENEPILAVYHAVSSGSTYSAEEVWGKEVDYLQSTSSEGDKLADNYTAVVEYSKDEIADKLSKIIDKKENTPIINDLKVSKSGLVESVKVYGEKVSGSELRDVLCLPSANYKYEINNGKYIFTCLGYGHGVGMSQRGADYMAKQGYTYKEILAHYYKGTVVK